jgi:transcriptional regulator with XRE-family HTH domain
MSRKKYQKLATILGLGVRLREVRKKVGLSQEEIGKKLGFGKSTIFKFETDNMIPDSKTLQRYAQIGETSIEQILRGEKSTTPLEQTPEVHGALPGPSLDAVLLAEILVEIKNFLAHEPLELSSQREARWVALVYDHCHKDKVKPDRMLVERFLWITKVN